MEIAFRDPQVIGGEEIGEISRFFADNVTGDYVSHGEVIGGRATPQLEFVPNLAEIIAGELERARTADPAGGSTVVTWRDSGALCAVALLGAFENAGERFVVIEDIVVRADLRGRGLGRGAMEQIVAHATARGAKGFLLESGANNARAHKFFAELGFAKISSTFMKRV